VIRCVWIGAMLVILSIVLYIPSAVPPERFLDVLRVEHAVNGRVWGDAAAARIMSRMLDMLHGSGSISEPPPPTVQVARQPSVDVAMANQLGQMSVRLFGNPYFRSIDALMALVAYRLSAVFELIPLLLIFVVVVAIDGFVVRLVRAKEFVPHSAELFGASVITGMLIGASVVIGFFLPFQLHPLFAAVALLAMFFVLSRALANYHLIR